MSKGVASVVAEVQPPREDRQTKGLIAARNSRADAWKRSDFDLATHQTGAVGLVSADFGDEIGTPAPPVEPPSAPRATESEPAGSSPPARHLCLTSMSNWI
jgi:hypothetical protein